MSDINVFDEQTPQQSTLDALVGEGKKYASVEDLAKAVVFKDQHINTLESETAQYREVLQGQVEAQRQQVINTPPSEQTGQRVDEVDLETRIRETLEKTNREQKVAKNVNEVSQKLVDVYGSAEKANQAVKTRADELGVSLSFLMDMAAQSPKALYAQLGLDTQVRNTPTATGSVNPAALAAINPSAAVQPGTYKFYEQMRKENPKLYNSPRVQLQMHKEAVELGEKFFA